MMDNERSISCNWHRARVVISFGAPDSFEEIWLTITEAAVLANKLHHELTSAQMARALGFPARSEFDVCDVLLSATEAGCLLDRLMSVIGEMQVASALHNRINWRRSGF